LGVKFSRRDGTDQRRTLEQSAMRWKHMVIMLFCLERVVRAKL